MAVRSPARRSALARLARPAARTRAVPGRARRQARRPGLVPTAPRPGTRRATRRRRCGCLPATARRQLGCPPALGPRTGQGTVRVSGQAGLCPRPPVAEVGRPVPAVPLAQRRLCPRPRRISAGQAGLATAGAEAARLVLRRHAGQVRPLARSGHPRRVPGPGLDLGLGLDLGRGRGLGPGRRAGAVRGSGLARTGRPRSQQGHRGRVPPPRLVPPRPALPLHPARRRRGRPDRARPDRARRRLAGHRHRRGRLDCSARSGRGGSLPRLRPAGRLAGEPRTGLPVVRIAVVRLAAARQEAGHRMVRSGPPVPSGCGRSSARSS